MLRFSALMNVREGLSLAMRLDIVGMIPALEGGCLTPVGKDRQILTRSGAGTPALQRWAHACLRSGDLKLQRAPALQRWAHACRYSPALQCGIHTETAL